MNMSLEAYTKTLSNEKKNQEDPIQSLYMNMSSSKGNTMMLPMESFEYEARKKGNIHH